MPLSSEEFHANARGAADADGRLPLSRMTGWDISPFEQEGLRVSPLRPPVMPEPPRQDEDPSTCETCSRHDVGIWFDEHWRMNRMSGAAMPIILMLYPRDHYDLDDRDPDVVVDALVASYGGSRTPK